MKKIARAELPKLFAAIAAQQTLYIPAQDGGAQARFTVWQEERGSKDFPAWRQSAGLGRSHCVAHCSACIGKRS